MKNSSFVGFLRKWERYHKNRFVVSKSQTPKRIADKSKSANILAKQLLMDDIQNKKEYGTKALSQR